MARVTVADCLDKVDNRFQLVLLAAKRTRQLTIGGAEAFVPWDNDKPTVVALREIAEGFITKDLLLQEDDDFADVDQINMLDALEHAPQVGVSLDDISIDNDGNMTDK